MQAMTTNGRSARRGWFARGAVVVASAAATLLVGASTAFADRSTAGPPADPVCGERIMVSATLHRDLLNCPGDGLIIGADDVTVNLNGHRVIGQGAGSGITLPLTTTVVHRVTVQNGQISGFGAGVGFANVEGAQLIGLHLSANRDGIVASLATNLTVRRSAIVDNTGTGSDGFAVRCLDCRQTLIEYSVLKNRVSFADSTNSQLTHNDLRYVDLGFAETGGDAVSGNRMLDSNIALFNVYGIDVHGNTMRSTTGSDDGIVLEGLSKNIRIADNTIVGYRYGAVFPAHGIVVGSLDELVGSSIVGNRFVRNGGAGVYLAGRHPVLAPPLLITGNLFFHNGFSGTAVDWTGRIVNDGLHLATDAPGGLTISGNRAVRNADYGIEVAAGTDDAGVVNHASGNGNAAQCLGVVCAP